MSRFFRAGSSESESESSEDEIQKPKITAPTRTYQFSDDEDDTKRVVRSAKDKRFEILQNTIKMMKNSMNINDISKIMTEYENLTRDYEKSKNVIQKEGVPNFYVKCLADLEDYIQKQWEDTEARKKLSKLNAKALASLRQKLKKYNRDFETEINEYKEDPSKFDEVEEEEVDEDQEEDEVKDVSDDDDDDIPTKKAEPEKVSRSALDDDDDSDDLFATDSDESSSSDDELPEGGRKQWGAWMFLKDTTSKDDKKGPKREKKKQRTGVEKASKQKDDGWTEVSKASDRMKALFPKDTEINHQNVLKKFHEILAVRGKKGTDRLEQVEFFVELKNISEKHDLGPALKLKLLFTICAAIIDSSMGTDSALKDDMWQRLLSTVSDVLDMIDENPDIKFNRTSDENVEDASKPYQIQEDPITLLEKLDAEFTKILQNCDGHSTDYIAKLKDERKVVQLIDQVRSHLQRNNYPSDSLCRVYLLRIEHTYYKLDINELKNIQAQIKVSEDKASKRGHKDETEGNTEADKEKDEQGSSPEKASSEQQTTSQEATEQVDKPDTRTKQEQRDENLLNQMCKYIYNHGADRIRTRAMLCHIYHHALHDRWYDARDLMLISHLQETISYSDVPTQILYNRTMVQLGLCAFRHGKIRDAHNALQDIHATNRAKEMLAQGLMNLKNMERTPEQEKIEKRRMMPFHMHINLELVECVHLTSAMLLEIPYMAAHEYDYRRRVISKSFQYQLRQSEKQALLGPAESMREHIVAASKAMKKGDWKKTRDHILAVSCWELFPNSDKVKEMITRKIQEESLRTYLFTYNKVYDNISLVSLAEMFELPKQVVHSTISKMIINEELQASWDEPTQTLILHHSAEPTYLQSLTLQLSDKLNTLTEHHERILDFKYGPLFSREQKQRTTQNRFGNRR